MHSFLSHSSSDKGHYVSILADKLGDRAIYDAYTFEAGMKTIDEILKNLERTDLFVLLISDAALESKWVRDEIINSKTLMDSGKIKQFLPIIIDRNINYKDFRIPSWIRENYNLRVIPKPNAAFRVINAAFSRLSIVSDPKSLRARKLFVGRNDQLKELEGRIDDFEKTVPSAVVASGLREIGRKKYILEGLRKLNRIDEFHNPISISLHYEDGLDGFISKLIDLGFSSVYENNINLGALERAEKISVLSGLLRELVHQNELIIIDDWRCIVQFGGIYADWFVEVCENLPKNKIYMCIASGSSPLASKYRKVDSIFHIKIPELDKNERIGLLVRYLREVEGIDELDIRQLSKFKEVLNGYPEQAIYAGEMIRDEGIGGALMRSSEIVDYARLKAGVYVEKYRDESLKFDFLTFLSWFEFVSLDFISKLASQMDENLFDIVNEFIEAGMCQLIGSLGEYVRLNDVIRDYIARGSIKIPVSFSKAVAIVSKDVLSSEEAADDFDYSEKAVSIRLALLEGREVPERLLIPAHFLNAISQNYKNKKYKDVIDLSERILQNINYEDYIRGQITHYYCMALARRRDKRFLSEVQRIKGKEYDYVLGFYYRITGRYSDAISRFTSAMSEQRWEENSKREIVLIYNITEDYDSAFSLARDSYYAYPSNPIGVLAYFEVLLNKYKIVSGNEGDLIAEMRATLTSISRVASEKGQEVQACMKARYEYYIKNNEPAALAILDDAIEQFTSSPYPLLVKMELGVSMKSADLIGEALQSFSARSFDDKQGATERKKAELFKIALDGNVTRAITLADKELAYINDLARERFKQRILAIQLAPRR